MDLPEITAAIRNEIEARGTNPYRAAKDARLPENSIRYFLEGHEPRAGRLIEICRALGLELHVGPRRRRGVEAGAPDDDRIGEPGKQYGGGLLPMRPSTPVRDRRLAEMITALAEQWEALNETGRDALQTRFHAFFPDLRKQGRLERLVVWLGWRVPQRKESE